MRVEKLRIYHDRIIYKEKSLPYLGGYSEKCKTGLATYCLIYMFYICFYMFICLYMFYIYNTLCSSNF